MIEMVMVMKYSSQTYKSFDDDKDDGSVHQLMKTVMIKIVLLLVMMKWTSHTDTRYGKGSDDVADDEMDFTY